MNEFNHLLPKIRDYLDQFPVTENNLQQEMRNQTREDGREHWLIPAEVGKFFYILSIITQAKRIYEIGSYLGYSATWFAEGLPKNGKVILTERDEKRFLQAQHYLQSSPYASRIEIRHCDAHEDLKSESDLFDIILIDHDKPHYSQAFDIAKEKIRKGGLIITDNVLWRGRIVDPKFTDTDTDIGSTAGVLDFNQHSMNDPEVDSLIVPIGDGVTMSILK